MIAKSTPTCDVGSLRLEAEHVNRGRVIYRIALRGEAWQAVATWARPDARGTPADGAVAMWKGSRAPSREAAVEELGVRLLADLEETYAAVFAAALEARNRATVFELSGRVPSVVARARDVAFRRAVGTGHAFARSVQVYQRHRRDLGLLPMAPLPWWLEEAISDIQEAASTAHNSPLTTS